MGTKELNQQKFQNLWNLFNDEISNTNKFEPKNLYGFSKYYIKHNPSIETTPKNLKRKLERWQEGISNKRNYGEDILIQLEEYYKFLNQEFYRQDLLPDEDTEGWFN